MISNGWPGAENRQFVARILSLFPMGKVSQPDDHGSKKRAEHLSKNIIGNFVPGQPSDARQANRDGWIEVRATKDSDRIDRDRHRRVPNRWR